MTQNLKGLKVLFLVAPKGFQDDELAKPRKVLEAAGAEVVVASSSTGPVTSQGGTSQEAISIVEARPTDFAGAVVVGGVGATDLWENGIAQKFFRMAAHDGKPIGALSLGVGLLAKAGLLEGKAATIWVTSDALRALKDGGARYEKKPVVIASGVVTADGPASADSFGNIFAELLDGSRTRSGRVTR
ncbi:MAG: DJ-1/PfpI family protein [Holophagales bacterium]|jgi:protease I|nr:DJ-1/PfpI family protein [Holophagales bacterium]